MSTQSPCRGLEFSATFYKLVATLNTSTLVEVAMLSSSLPEPSLASEQVLDCLGAIARCIQQACSLDDILNTATLAGRELLHTDRVLISRFQPDGSSVVVAESVGSDWTPILGQTIPEACFETNWVEFYRQGNISAIADIDTSDIQPRYLELLAQFQVRASLLIPILLNRLESESSIQNPKSKIQNPLWGLLIVHHCAITRQWQPLEVKFLQQLAVHLGIAIQQTELYQQVQTERQQRQEVEAKLQANEQFLRSICEGAANSIFVVDVFETENSEFRIQESEERNQEEREFHNSSAEFPILTSDSCILTPSYKFCFAGLNPAHERLTGLAREEMQGKSPEQMLPPAVAAELSAIYATCVQVGTTISYEECIPFQGEDSWWLTTLTPLRDAQSRIYRLIGTSINITERKQAEEELKRQQEFLYDVIDTNSNLIYVKDWEGKFRLVNQAFADIYGTTIEDLTGKTDADFSPTPAEVEHYLQDDRQVMSSLQPKFIPQETLTSATGEVHYLQTIKKPLLSPDGQARYVLAVATDITERKQVEEALQQSETRYRAIVEDQTELICRFLPSGILTFVNEAYCRYFGKRPEELIGFNFMAFLPDEQRREVEKYLASLTRENPVGMLEHQVVRPDGEVCWQQWNDRAILDETGCLIEFQSVGRDITDRKQAEVALKNSEAQLRTLVANIPGVVYRCTHNQEWQLLFISDEIEGICGYPVSDFTGGTRGFASIIYPEDLGRVEQALEAALQERQPFTLEYRIVRNDGSLRWVYEKGQGIFGDPGELLWLDGVILDITARKRAEQERDREAAERYRLWQQIERQNQTLEAQVQERTAQLSVANEQLQQEVAERKQVEESLRESEARFRRLFESNIVGVIFADTSGRIADANDVFLQMVGYTREDLREGKVHWDELSPPEYRQLELRAIEQSKTTGIITPWEKEFFRKDGSRVPVLVGGVLLDEFDGQGIAFVLDISDRKRTEKALRESEQQFRQIFQEAPVGMTLIDFQTHQFIQVNPAYYQLLGYAPSEIMSLTFDELTHPDDLPENLHYMEQINRGKSDSFCMEKRYFKKNGELVWANLTVTVLRNQNGKPGFCLAMIEDITERKQAEEQLKTSLQEKETLLKEIHHRVKNNLQIISSLLRLQSRQIRDQQVLELFKDSQNRVQAMALIHELLYQSPNLAHIDFQKYIQTLAGNLCRSYNVHQRAITFKINVEQVSLAIDTAIPCGLIINELVSNSLKHGFPEHHGGEICISFQHGDNGQFILSISDNGVGMGSDFDFRNTNSLGLQLVCRLTKQLEGSIELNRERGTEFKIAFATPK